MNAERVEQRKMAFDHYEGAVISGFRFAFNKKSVKFPGSASANVVLDAASEVEGVVYHLTDEKQILMMDPFEGYPTRYDRQLVPAVTKSGVINVWVYIANPEHIEEGLRPNLWYLNHLLAGKVFLSDSYYATLSSTKCLPQSEVEPE